MSDSAHRETTRRSLEDELTRLEAEIGRQRLIREKATYRLEQAVRELDRLVRHGPGDSPLPYNTSETLPTFRAGRPSSTEDDPEVA